MKIIIDIPKSLYMAINNKYVFPVQIDELCRAVLNGKKVWTNRFDECGRCYWDERKDEKANSTDSKERENRCKNCEYSRNPDYTRCHECKAESEEQDE